MPITLLEKWSEHLYLFFCKPKEQYITSQEGCAPMASVIYKCTSKKLFSLRLHAKKGWFIFLQYAAFFRNIRILPNINSAIQRKADVEFFYELIFLTWYKKIQCPIMRRLSIIKNSWGSEFRSISLSLDYWLPDE